MKSIVVLALFVLLAAIRLVQAAQTFDLSGKVAFVSLSTYKLSAESAAKEEFAPHVLVGFTQAKTVLCDPSH